MRSPFRDPLVTVGITSYNEAGLVARCLRSIVDQSLDARRIEVIVVDDGSAEGTARIAAEFRRSARWSRFTVVEQENTGNASTGRNTVLDRARGQYLFFVDADDYLGADALAAMTGSAERHGSDVVVGRYVGVNRSAPNAVGIEDLPEVHEYHSGWMNTLHIQKLFRTQFLRGLSYRFNPQLNYANDHPFMMNAFLHATTVSFVNDVDCYVITLEDSSGRTGSGHISRRVRPPQEQLRFLHDCFGVLALARGQGGPLATLAGRMRADYWNRLLKVHLPVLMLRRDTDEEVEELARTAINLTELYGAETTRASLVPEARAFVEDLRTGGAAHVLAAAHAARRETSAANDGSKIR